MNRHIMDVVTGRDKMHIGNGYMPDHGSVALELKERKMVYAIMSCWNLKPGVYV